MKTNQIIKNCIIISLSVLIYGCNSLERQAASEAELQLTQKLSDGFQPLSFDVLAAENYGNEVEPEIKARFEFSVKPKFSWYEKEETKFNKLIVNETVTKGKTMTIGGTYTARLKGGKWSINFDINNDLKGRPLSDWGGSGYVVVKNSPQYQQFMKNIKQLKQAVQECLDLSSSMKTRVMEYYYESDGDGTFPSSNDEAGFNDNLSASGSGYSIQAGIKAKGVVECTITAESDILDGQVVTWVPRDNYNNISWTCSTSIPAYSDCYIR